MLLYINPSSVTYVIQLVAVLVLALIISVIVFIIKKITKLINTKTEYYKSNNPNNKA